MLPFSSTRLRFLPTYLACVLLSALASAQAPGEVSTFTKISETAGGFGGSLNADDAFGRTVANIGDIDGDGIADLAAGAILRPDASTVQGAVWILFMNSNGTVRTQQRISQLDGFPATNADGFGSSIIGLGDLDGDGKRDIAVGAPNDDDGGQNRGAVHVLFLETDGTVLSSAKISGTSGGMTGTLNNNDNLGAALEFLGDLGGDGKPEIAVGATGDDDGGPNHGAVWIFTLETTGTVSGITKISDTSGSFDGILGDQDRFGNAIANLGDIDGDGKTDIAVGMSMMGAANMGAVFVLLLETDGTVRGEQRITQGESGFAGALAAEDRFGLSLAGIPDLNLDGVADLAVGSLDNDGGADRGAVWILFMRADGTALGTQKISSDAGNFRGNLQNGDSFGSSVANVGDLDGNGLDELAVGARNDDDGDAPNQGALYLISLQEGFPVAPTVGFGTSPTSGTAPLTVSFTDTSTGNVSQWSWDFGDGSTSTERHPMHTYAGGGSFDVTLTATGIGGSDTVTRSGEVVLGAPTTVANFTATPRSGVVPLTVNFSDLSTGGISGWAWTFGDGGTSTLQNPSHTYNAVGTYNVTLQATGPLGTDSFTAAGFVVVTPPPPTASFSADVATGPAPLTVTFTNLSSGDITAYNWRFGDGAANVLTNPVHTYTEAGTYTVRLTAKGPGGETTDVRPGMIIVGNAATLANFETNPTSGAVPLTVSFTDRSTGDLTSWSWDFGDGSVSTLQNPTHTYAAVGTYTVSLTADGPSGTDTRTRTDVVQVNPPGPTADFVADATSGQAPLAVNFTDLSTGNITSWSWRFGDGSGSAQQNPSKTYTLAGTYSVVLTVDGPEGPDEDTKTGYVVVSPAGTRASFDGQPTRGEVPLTVIFADRSTGDPTSWSWDFGDGATSTLQNPTHTYSAIGTYTVSLSADGPNGPNTLSRTDFIVVNPVGPTAAFSADVLSGQAPLTVNFTDLSTGDVTSYDWRFGDGTTSIAQNPTKVYTQAGTYSVVLTVDGPSGTDTLSNNSLIVVGAAGTRVAFTATPATGEVPLTVTFADRSTGGATTFSWDFGDGTTSTLQNPTHTYTAVGTYSVTLAADGPNGTDSLLRTNLVVVTPPGPTAAFTADPVTGQAPLTVNFTDFSTGNITSYSWRFGDGTGTAVQSPAHTYTQAGTYSVVLTVEGPDGLDSLSQNGLVVVGAAATRAAFDAQPTTGEVPLTVVFADRSTGGSTTFSWDFGDGSSSTLQNPTHTYSTVGTYTVTQTVDGPNGLDMLAKTDFVVVRPPAPVASFTADPVTGQEPLTVSFTDFSTGNVTSYSWRFGDGTGSAAQNPTHTYTTAGTYNVVLTVEGPDGLDTLAQNGLVVVGLAPTRALFDAQPVTGEVPLMVNFADRSTGGATTWSWDFGDGTTSTVQDPNHIYGTPGTYSVTLTADGPNGSDTLVKGDLVIVTPPSPVAAFSATPINGPSPLTVTFTDLSTGDVTGHSWRFGDTTTSAQQNPVKTYTTPGTYTVALTVSGPGGDDTLSQGSLIVVSDADLSPAFEANPTTGPVPLTVQFIDRSTGNVTSYSWDFGDGGTSSLQNPNHVYANTGTYTVTQTVTGPAGTETLVRTDVVTVTPPAPVASFSSDLQSGQAPLLVTFTDQSTGDVTAYSWRFGDGGGSALQSPTHVYTQAGTYTVALTVTGPFGEDIDTQVALITVAPAGVRSDFDALPLRGEVPLSVTFVDRSTGGATSFAWDFGDGTTSTLQNPTHTYAAVGTYSVTLTAGDGTEEDIRSKADYIVVNPQGPTAGFSADPTVGTAPLTVTFTDQSTGTITSYLWRFGDLTTSAGQNPSHTYTQAGTYTVALTVDGPEGDSTLSLPNLIVVEPAQTAAAFDANPVTGPVPLTVQFIDRSTGNATSFAWDFGDGGSSTVENPAHTYANTGTYTVSLTATGANGTDTITQTDLVVVTGPAPVADFTVDVTTGAAPLTVNFSDLSTGDVTSYSWRFGDATGSAQQNPTHIYQQAGTYTVALTVEGPNGDSTLSRNSLVVVSPPATQANFGAVPTSGEAPLTVSFVDLTIGGATSFAWDFGDGSTSTLESPSHVYTAVGTYTVSLTANGPNGEDTLTRTDFIVATPIGPQASFIADPLTGEAPVLVSFTDTSTGTVTAYSWRFGDGSASQLQNPNHAYTEAGTYNVSLTVRGPDGENSLVQTGLIVIDPPVTRASFDASPTDGEAPLTVSFTDTSRGFPDSWSWDFGDGSTSALRNPTHVYMAVGTYSVTLTASGPNGTDTITQTNVITVEQPVTRANFLANPTSGDDPLTVSFNNTSTGSPDTFQWDFGDGTTSSLSNPSHVYSTGTFTVSLTASGPNGTDTLTQTDLIIVTPPVTRASFTATPNAGLVPLQVLFRNHSTGGPTSFSWDFGDGGTSSLFEPTHTYNAAGTYTVALTASGPNGTDTLTRTDLVVVTEPALVADFAAAPLSGILPLTVSFTDFTSGNATSYAWDFGDGSTSTQQNPTHAYTTAGLFTVSLTASRASGSDTRTRTDLIDVSSGTTPPTVDFAATPLDGPVPLTVFFNDLTSGDVTSYLWDFGDGSTSTLQDPSHVYVDAGTYSVSLTATGPAGMDTLNRADYVAVFPTPEILDGSFEDQLVGQLPAAPWIVPFGTSHLVQPATPGTDEDGGFPTGRGTNWLELSAAGTSAATPPSFPNGTSAPPIGTAGIRQSFELDLTAPFLAMNVAFLLREPFEQTSTNDFMSVDVTDGSTNVNLFYADSFSAFTGISLLHGLPITDVIQVRADLRSFFPGTPEGTTMTVNVTVGNFGDGANSSLGYVDQISLSPVATSAVRNGLGVNPICYDADPPVLGGTWTATIDSTQVPATTLALVYAYAFPSSGIVLDIGEILMDLASPNFFAVFAPIVGNAALLTVDVPADLSLVGVSSATQAVLVGPTVVQFCNAVDVLLGF